MPIEGELQLNQCRIPSFSLRRGEEAFRPDLVFNPYVQRMFQVDFSRSCHSLTSQRVFLVYCSTCHRTGRASFTVQYHFGNERHSDTIANSKRKARPRTDP